MKTILTKKLGEMERNTQTTICELQIGDRFYRTGDKNKVVWEIVESDLLKTHFQTYKHFAIQAGMKFPQPMKKHTAVIFLRHKTETNGTN
jgi:hypothetical protein